MIAIIGDAHLRDGDDIISKFRLYSFRKAYEILRKRGVSTVIVAGDLFDKPVVSPYLVSQVVEAITIPTYAIAGNHDTDLSHGSAVWYVNGGKVVSISDVERCLLEHSVSCAFVPYVPGSDARMEIERAIELGRSDLMVGHFGVYDYESEPKWMRNDRWFITNAELLDLLDKSETKLCVFGHKHIATREDLYSDAYHGVAGIGAISPCAISETGVFGNVVFIDSGLIDSVKFEHEMIPGIRYGQYIDYTNTCIVCSEDDGGNFADYSDILTDADLDNLLGNRILIERGIINQREKLDIDLDDPSCRASIDAAINEYISSMVTEEKESLRKEALDLLYGDRQQQSDHVVERIVGNVFYGIAKLRKYE